MSKISNIRIAIGKLICRFEFACAENELLLASMAAVQALLFMFGFVMPLLLGQPGIALILAFLFALRYHIVILRPGEILASSTFKFCEVELCMLDEKTMWFKKFKPGKNETPEHAFARAVNKLMFTSSALDLMTYSADKRNYGVKNELHYCHNHAFRVIFLKTGLTYFICRHLARLSVMAFSKKRIDNNVRKDCLWCNDKHEYVHYPCPPNWHSPYTCKDQPA